LTGLTADELAHLAASGTQGWVSTDHVTWVLKQLNNMQNDTMLLCPNVVVNIHNKMTRKAKLFDLGPLKRLGFALNVGQRNGKTFIGSLPQTSLMLSMILHGTFHKLKHTKESFGACPLSQCN